MLSCLLLDFIARFESRLPVRLRSLAMRPQMPDVEISRAPDHTTNCTPLTSRTRFRLQTGYRRQSSPPLHLSTTFCPPHPLTLTDLSCTSDRGPSDSDACGSQPAPLPPPPLWYWPAWLHTSSLPRAILRLTTSMMAVRAQRRRFGRTSGMRCDGRQKSFGRIW